MALLTLVRTHPPSLQIIRLSLLVSTGAFQTRSSTHSDFKTRPTIQERIFDEWPGLPAWFAGGCTYCTLRCIHHILTWASPFGSLSPFQFPDFLRPLSGSTDSIAHLFDLEALFASCCPKSRFLCELNFDLLSCKVSSTYSCPTGHSPCCLSHQVLHGGSPGH